VSGGDYLWDGTGKPDPDVERLERVLRPLRHARPAPEMPARERRRVVRARGWWPLAAAAAVILAVAIAWMVTPARREGWTLAWLEGASWSDARVVREDRIGAGVWIDTRASRARLAVGNIGEVDLEPSTRVSLVDLGSKAHRLSLARGVMHAMIWAPPGQFVVDTPSAIAVDLGCRYTLEVKEDGSGVLRVEAGWVGFEHAGGRSLVPAGAVSDTRRGKLPGTPHFEDASAAFSEALDVIDFGGTADARRAAIETLTAEARPRDAISLWHLLSRVEGDARAHIHDRLASLVPPPAGVSRDGVLRGDRTMLDAWWDELGLGSSETWRTWTAQWPE
jgi:hypothetical protein